MADGGTSALALQGRPSISHFAAFDYTSIATPRFVADVLATPEWRAVLGEYGIIILDAGTGSGKTTFVADMTRASRVLVATDRVALATQLQGTFAAKLRPLGATRQERQRWAHGDRLATTIQSPGFQVVSLSGREFVVDEANRVLDTISGGAVCPRSRAKIERALASGIRDSDRTWLIEAGWTREDVEMLSTYLRVGLVEKRILWIRVETPVVHREAEAVFVRERVFERFIRDVERGEPAILFCTSKQACHRVHGEVLRRMGREVLVLSSETSDSARVRDWLNHPTSAHEPFVIASPSVVSGLDIPARGDGSPEYPTMYLDGHIWAGWRAPGLSDLVQFIGRVRCCRRLVYFATLEERAIPDRQAATRLEQTLQDATTARLKGAAAHASARPMTIVDWLSEWRSIRRARSWAAAPTDLRASPMSTFAAEVRRLGWTAAAPQIWQGDDEDALRSVWREAREREDRAYAARVLAGPRGRAAVRVAADACAEIGHTAPAHLGPIDGPKGDDLRWYLVEHRDRTPITLALATFRRDLVVQDDDAEADLPCRGDRRHLLVAGDLLRCLLVAAGIDPDRALAGDEFTLTRASLGEYARVANRYHTDMFERLGHRAPESEQGRVRSATSVFESIGFGVVESRQVRAGSGDKRERRYFVQLHEAVRDALKRRITQRTFAEPPPLPGAVTAVPDQREEVETSVTAEEVKPIVTPESPIRVDIDAAVVQVLSDCAPLQVDPAMAAEIESLRQRAADVPADRARLTQVCASLGNALACGGRLVARAFDREESGRIHLHNAPIQGVPKSVRHLIRPHAADSLFVSGDFRNMHVSIAARWTGDLSMYILSDEGYEALAAELLPNISDARTRVKLALLSVLNGATARTLTGHLGDAQAARRLKKSLPQRFPGLIAKYAEMQRAHAAHSSMTMPSLSGARTRLISRRRGPEGWRTWLSSVWSVTEAEALDRVLASLPFGSRLAVPLYDGLLLTCPRDQAGRVAAELRTHMEAAAHASGFRARAKVGIGDTWGAAETSAT